jgi:putative acetyltransferase
MSDFHAIAVRPAVAPDDMETVRALFLEYGRSLNFDLCFQGFEQELASLPGCYAQPRGQILLAIDGNDAAGVVALRPLEQDICEMKRLYVRRAWRGRDVGRRLARAIIDEGKRRGYRAMRLDTHASMISAITLYRGLGFREIPPYYDNPLTGFHYCERALIG